MDKIVTYRLEFNEKQQHFHLDNYTHEPETFGWVTLIEHCTDIEFEIFESYANARTRSENYTIEYLQKCVIETEKFLKNITEYGLIITNK